MGKCHRLGSEDFADRGQKQQFPNLLAAENYASAHANYVSNNWGGSEFSGENAYDSNFVRSGVLFFFAAGDSGLPTDYPYASPNVISVGGTLLTFNTNGSLASETGWTGGGGGRTDCHRRRLQAGIRGCYGSGNFRRDLCSAEKRTDPAGGRLQAGRLSAVSFPERIQDAGLEPVVGDEAPVGLCCDVETTQNRQPRPGKLCQ
jgi:hypothetical protein